MEPGSFRHIEFDFEAVLLVCRARDECCIVGGLLGGVVAVAVVGSVFTVYGLDGGGLACTFVLVNGSAGTKFLCGCTSNGLSCDFAGDSANSGFSVWIAVDVVVSSDATLGLPFGDFHHVFLFVMSPSVVVWILACCSCAGPPIDLTTVDALADVESIIVAEWVVVSPLDSGYIAEFILWFPGLETTL